MDRLSHFGQYWREWAALRRAHRRRLDAPRVSWVQMPGADAALSRSVPCNAGSARRLASLRGRLYTGTVMVPLWLEKAMPTTLTLKNIPDEVYERLKDAAKAHRRSLNSEAIVCLETVLTPTKIAPSERLARARQLRAGLSTTKFLARDIDTLKRQGRP